MSERPCKPPSAVLTDYPKSGRQIFELGDFPLLNGFTLPSAKLAYKTHGRLNANKDNAILFPHFLGGAPEALEQWIGIDRPLDPTDYFFILPGQFGVDPSSSPSNMPPPYNGPAFPQVTIADDVIAQNRLVTKLFGISSLHMVLGWSVGALQTYEWAVRYSSMVQRVLSIAGAPKPSPWTRLWLRTVVEEPLTSDPAWNKGWYADPRLVQSGQRGQGRAAALTLPPHSFYDEGQEAWRTLGFTSNDDFVSRFWEAFWLPQDPNNLITQARKAIAADPSGGGDLSAALSRITAKTLVVAFSGDPMFPPNECERDARRIRHGRFREINAVGGHLATFGLFDSDRTAIDNILAEAVRL